MATVESDLNDTLALVNAARMAFGKDVLTELPDSVPGASADCLYYRALHSVGIGSVSGTGKMRCEDERQAAYLASVWGVPHDGSRDVQAPTQFSRTIGRFDNKHFDHYETHDAPSFEKKHF